MEQKQVGKYRIAYNVDRYIKQVLEDSEYDFMSYYPIIIDIGANIGMFSLSMYDKADTIYAIEPSEENIQCLQTTISLNHLAKIKPYHAAISDTSVVKKVAREGDPGMGGWRLSESGDYPVRAVTLKDFMDENRIQYVDLVKMDVEGHELQILNSGDFPKDQIGTIIGEWHHDFEPIEEKLIWLGYKVIDMGNNHFIARKI